MFRIVYRNLIAFVAFVGLITACAPTTAAPTPQAAPDVPTAVASVAPAAPAAVPTAAAKSAEPTAAPTVQIKRGGLLRDIIKGVLDSGDPVVTTLRQTPAMGLMFDTLLNYKLVDPKTEQFEMAPGLAESYKVIDSKTIEFKLRKGVKFHDGTDFGTTVAKWNIERAATHPKSQLKQTVAAIDNVQVVDDTTLRLNLKAPSALVPIQMTSANQAGISMISRDALEKMGEDGFARNPVGTGPMKFKEWVRDVRIEVEKAPNFWEAGADRQPLPYLDGYVGTFIPDTSVSIIQLRTGNADLFVDLELKDVPTVRGNPDLMIEKVPADWISYPGFRFNPRPGTSLPFSNNLKLRQAAHYATDRNSIAETLGFGMARPAYYPLWFPGMLGYDESLPRYEYDLAKAKGLVAEAGFSDGVDLDVRAINRPLDVRPLEILQSMWAKAGIRLSITTSDRLPWIEDGRSGKFGALSNVFKSQLDTGMQTAYRTDGGDNWAGYSNPEVDRIWAQSEAEYDAAKRAELYKKVLRIGYEDGFHLAGYMYPRVAGFSKKVKDYVGWFNMRYVWLDK